MSHADARPVARETGREEAQVEALLHMAVAFEPEQPAPSGLEASVAAKLSKRRSIGFPWLPRTGWPTLTVAGGAVAAVAYFWLPTLFPLAPGKQAATSLVAISPPISAAPALAREQAISAPSVHPVTWNAEDDAPSARHGVRREERRTRRRYPTSRRFQARRTPSVPTVRWEVEQVGHEIERTTASGWWVTQNEDTGDLEAAPATLEVVSTREVPPTTVFSCAPPEQEGTPSDTETMSAPGSQPSAPEENPKQ